MTPSLLELPLSSAVFSTGVAGVPVGAVVSTVIFSALLALLTLPALSVALAVMECTPSLSPMLVTCAVPLSLVVPVLNALLPFVSYTVTLVDLSPLKFRLTMVSLVTLSFL